MSVPDSAATVITHNKPKRQKVTSRAMKTEGYFFQRITYSASLAKIRALIGRSARCRQFVSFECFKSRLLNAPGGVADVRWLSSASVLQNYWGGAPVGSNMCACGATGTCVDRSKYCNCDIWDEKWREDSGNELFVTHNTFGKAIN